MRQPAELLIFILSHHVMVLLMVLPMNISFRDYAIYHGSRPDCPENFLPGLQMVLSRALCYSLQKDSFSCKAWPRRR